MEQKEINNLGEGKLLFWRAAFLFTLLFMLTTDFSFELIPKFNAIVKYTFQPLATWTCELFGYYGHSSAELSSDTAGAYANVLNCILLSIGSAFIWRWVSKTRSNFDHKIIYWTKVLIAYYVALVLFKYGFNKVFKWQFYSPEPNILYTRVGNLDKDMLFWTTLGTSWLYSFLTGLIEILCAALLLFNRTRLIGALLGIGVMVNIFMINISFDISVKLYSFVLLVLLLFIVSPYFRVLYDLFIRKKVTQFPNVYNGKVEGKWVLIKRIAKTFCILLIFCEALYVYAVSGNFNDDNSRKSDFRGAYEVTVQEDGGNVIDWKRVFIHRHGYFIVESSDNLMTDYKIDIDKAHQNFLLTDYRFDQQYVLHYTLQKDQLLLRGLMNGDSVNLELNKINIDDMPALKPKFHWTIDH